MDMNTAIAALLGGLLVGGVVMVGIGIAPIHQLSTGQSTSLWTRVDNWFSRLPRRSRVHGLTGLGIGVVGYVVTGLARDLAGSYQMPFMVLTALAVLMTLLAWALRRGSARPST